MYHYRNSMEVSQGRVLACIALENAWGPSELPPLFLPAAGTELASGTRWPRQAALMQWSAGQVC